MNSRDLAIHDAPFSVLLIIEFSRSMDFIAPVK